MIKIFILFITFTILISAQQKNKQIVDEKSGKMMLIGVCDRTAFADTSFAWWFNSEYENYSPDSLSISILKPIMGNTTITIIMGSWCSDSRIEVPRFYKIIDAVGYDADKLKLICVDRDKKSPDGEVEKLEIKLVPTFIFYIGGKEIGRVLESPKKKMEEDLVSILVN